MEGGFVVEFVDGALPNRVVLDDLLHDIREEGRLFPSLGVFVLDDCLGHEVVHVVLFFEIACIELGLDVDRTDAVLQAF